MVEEEYLRKMSLDDIQNTLNSKYSENLKRLFEDKNFKDLNDEINKFNPFKILKLENYEIRHSNFLAWLLNTNGSHGLKNLFFTEILEELEFKEITIGDDTQVEVLREHKNIDILIKTDNNLICAIENKVWGGERGDQLNRYENYINEVYSEEKYKKLFIYLTRTGVEASNKEYKSLSYEQIRKILLKAKKNIKTNIKTPVKEFIGYYIDILENDLMLNPSKLIKDLCGIISQNHSEILKYLYNAKNYINDVQIADNSLYNLYKKGVNTINIILNNQNKLKDDRDAKIYDLLIQCFNEKYIEMHSNWAYKLNVENEPYPFKQVDYTTLPFENIMVRFYCGISTPKSKSLIDKINEINKTKNFIEILKTLKAQNYSVAVGYRINNGSGYGIIDEFLTDDFNKFNEILSSFAKHTPGVYKKDNIGEIEKLPLISEKGLKINDNAKQIVFLPVIYIMKEIDKDIDNSDEIKKQFFEITKNVFEIFQLGNFELYLKNN